MSVFGVNPSEVTQTISSGNASTAQGNLAKINEAYALIDSRYVEDVKDEKLVEGAIQGMLSTLKDLIPRIWIKKQPNSLVNRLIPN